MKNTIKLKNVISPYVKNINDIFLHYKGRVSLYNILISMGVGKGDEVIIPAFTCVVVANSIKYLGAKPIYVDICDDDYNIDISLLEEKIGDKTKVIICQNTFGLSSNLEEIKAIAAKHKLYTIEDCTHGFGGFYNNIPNGLSCDAAFYSMQWNKPFSSGIGGFAIINNSKLQDSMRLLEKELEPVPLKNRILLKLQYFAYRFILNKSTYWFLIKLYRYLSKIGIVVGSSSGKEISGIEMPSHFNMAYSNVQAKEATRNLNNLPTLLDRRKRNAKVYTNFFKKNNKIYVKESLFINHSFLKYPFLVKDRSAFLQKAIDQKIELGEWFLSPIHPIEENFELWDLEIDKFPKAKYYSEHMLNVPTDEENINYVLAFLKRNIDDLL